MKKSIILIAIAIIIGANVFAQVNRPGAPSFETSSSDVPSSAFKNPGVKTQQQQPRIDLPQTQQANSKKAQLDALAMNILRAAEKRDQQTQDANFKKMMEKGIEEFCQVQVISKRTPTCPAIKININGRTMSGSTCVQMCYVLDGKQQDVGYCK